MIIILLFDCAGSYPIGPSWTLELCLYETVGNFKIIKYQLLSDDPLN